MKLKSTLATTASLLAMLTTTVATAQSMDDLVAAATAEGQLTTIALPTQDLGRIAAAQVLAALAGQPIAQQSLLPFQLLVRGTTGRAPSK